ncbi:MAG TPA: 50S ribosomal protein L5 [Candidatus Gracilibacteria bacterium]|nr:50S ribosomal protein L5 [Candidatus Gracilibacteria bacterium]
MATQLMTLREKFVKEIAPALQKELGIKNVWAVPRLKFVKLNVGLGPYIAAKKDYSDIITNLGLITGQKPVVTKAKKSISNFKIREGLAVGVTVTIRGKRMYDFVSKLVNITFPRVRDFRGISPKGFDGHGSYTVGISENTVFPEINPDNIEKIHGLQITFVTTAKDDESGRKLLKAMGFPFQTLKAKKSSQ